MKKLTALVLALLLALSCAACGASTPEVTEPEGEDPALIFQFRGTEIPMHASAAPIVTALGEPRSYTEAPSCAFEGMDKTYYYGSFYMTTYTEEGEDKVYTVWFADDGAETAGGICIGSTKAEVEAAYPQGTWCEGQCFVTGRHSTLHIGLENDVVVRIQYTADVQAQCPTP